MPNRVEVRKGWAIKSRVDQLESDMDDNDVANDKMRKSIDRLTGAVMAAVFTFGTSAVLVGISIARGH